MAETLVLGNFSTNAPEKLVWKWNPVVAVVVVMSHSNHLAASDKWGESIPGIHGERVYYRGRGGGEHMWPI